jgi:hypothetical protein
MLTIHAGGNDHNREDDKMTMTVMMKKWQNKAHYVVNVKAAMHTAALFSDKSSFKSVFFTAAHKRTIKRKVKLELYTCSIKHRYVKICGRFLTPKLG